MGKFPYEDRFPVNRTLPAAGRPRAEVLAELQAMAKEEDAFWETGRCSGTMYCGDHEHYAFMNDAFGLFAHVNALQRDMCPSQTKFEGEIIAMTLDLMHGEAADGEAAGMVTTGGTGDPFDARVNGGLHSGDEAVLDGVSMQQGYLSQSGMVSILFDFPYSPDMVSEIKVVGSSYAPEYGGSTSGQIVAVTKSGTDRLHGAAFEYFRHHSLNARPWGLEEKPDNEQHNFGANIGGPLRPPTRICERRRAHTILTVWSCSDERPNNG